MKPKHKTLLIGLALGLWIAFIARLVILSTQHKVNVDERIKECHGQIVAYINGPEVSKIECWVK